MLASSASTSSRTRLYRSRASVGSWSTPPGARHGGILLARASDEEQAAHIGNQTGGRVFLFLYTDDFERDYAAYREKGVLFVRPPREMPYGKVAVFRDLYGNLWDLLEPKHKWSEE